MKEYLLLKILLIVLGYVKGTDEGAFRRNKTIDRNVPFGRPSVVNYNADEIRNKQKEERHGVNS
jgi:hypothetical protein